MHNIKRVYINDLILDASPNDLVMDVVMCVMIVIGSSQTWDQALKEMRYSKFLDDLKLYKTSQLTKDQIKGIKKY